MNLELFACFKGEYMVAWGKEFLWYYIVASLIWVSGCSSTGIVNHSISGSLVGEVDFLILALVRVELEGDRDSEVDS